jgi:hypothetical protein
VRLQPIVGYKRSRIELVLSWGNELLLLCLESLLIVMCAHLVRFANATLPGTIATVHIYVHCANLACSVCYQLELTPSVFHFSFNYRRKSWRHPMPLLRRRRTPPRPRRTRQTLLAGLMSPSLSRNLHKARKASPPLLRRTRTITRKAREKMKKRESSTRASGCTLATSLGRLRGKR